jgi:hypothetical protein
MMDNVDISTYESVPVLSFRSTLGQIEFGKQVAKRENNIGNIPTSPRGGSRNMEQAHTSQAALISGIRVPDSTLANEVTEFIRDTESTLLFDHSSRVYYFGAPAGQRRGLKFIPIFPQKFLIALGLLSAVLLLPGLLQAQNAVTGALTGVVQDPSGAIVPGANVKIVDTATNAIINVTTNDA